MTSTLNIYDHGVIIIWLKLRNVSSNEFGEAHRDFVNLTINIDM